MSRRPTMGVSRRAMLRGAVAGGAVAIGLPWLEAIAPREASAQGTAAPKRVIFWFTANGTRQDIWTPPADLSIEDHPLHAPLAPFKEQLIFLDGVDQKVAYDSIGDGHQTGMACLLTNTEILPGSLFCEGSCDGEVKKYVGWGGGVSIDQYIAGRIEQGAITKFRSLELGVQVKSSTVWSRMCYAGPDQPLPAREDPTQNFDDFFADLDTDPFALELLRRKRKSVLDAVIADYEAFNKKLGAEDKARLDQHLASIRAVEKRLDASGVFGEMCEVPAVELPGSAYQQNDMYPVTGKAQMDLLVMALACDLTRVASLQWSRSVSNVQFNWVDQVLGGGHHDLSHYGDDSVEAKHDLLQINRWYTEQFAYLLGEMSKVVEGDGTLLDNSVVVWVNELGKGNSHTRSDIPFILAGGCQGYFKTGQALDLGGAPHGKLLVSLCHAMGYTDVATFGVEQYSQGPLAGLT